MNAKRRIVAWLASLAVAILLAPSIAGAEEMSYSALMSRIDALEEQLHEQHADFVAYEMGGAQKDDGDGKGNGKGNGGRGRSVYFGYEATVLRPYISDRVPGRGFDNEYGVGHRLTLGGENDSGVGARVRYWFYDHGHDAIPPLAPGLPGIHVGMDVFDLEATLSDSLCNWDILVSGGARYGRAQLSDGTANVYFEGTGPTVSLAAQREVGNRGLYLVGNFRASFLIGEIHETTVIDGLIGDDELTSVFESQLGVGWSRCMGRAMLDVRALWETQFWMNDTFNDDVGFGSNLGLSGATLSAGVRY